MSDLLHDLQELGPGIVTTLWLTVLSFVLGFPLAVLVAIAFQSKHKLITAPLVVAIEILRGMPALLTLYFVYYGLPEQGIVLSATWSACLAFALTFVAYTAPIIAAAIAMVPAAHVEAGEALGLGRTTITLRIVLPQALRAALPPLISWTVILFQGTSLAGWVGTSDLFAMAKSQGAQDYRYLYHLAVAAGVYAAISIPFLALAARLERRRGGGSGIRGLARSLRRAAGPSAVTPA
ncbi:amino acid ABC transporter permease [Nocardioides sp. GXZ039]|uniref:amino acid ABC transporter permease n=1 Tax=Nocardioides sp. GXZ039 TaxID=3136018 RepID=UPI0030F3B382